MDDRARTSTASPKSRFLREGWRELLRRWERGKLHKQVQKSDEERNSALTRLGENAWNANVDLSALPELREQLTRLAARADELTAAAKKLEEEKAALESQRQAESARFDSLQQAVLEKKRPVDTALTAARERLALQDAAIKALQARLASLAAATAALGKEPALPAQNSAPTGVAQPPDLEKRKQELEFEQTLASQELAKLSSTLPQVSAEVRRNYEESQRHEQELTKIAAERKAALAPIESSLDRVARDTNAASQEAGTVAQQRRAVFAQLGLGLYERKSAEPALAAGMLEVAGIDRSRAGTQAGLEASLAASRAIPRGTMLKFWSTLVFLPLLLIASVYGIAAGWSWWQERHQPKEDVTSPPINPYLVHALSHSPAYALADRLTGARSEQEVATLMLEAFQRIHLGVYTHDGKQILSGTERSEKDFFLYDFHWKTLARAFFRHNVQDLADHNVMLGRVLLRLNDPSQLSPVLRRALLVRYHEALRAPDDPNSYLIFLVDALGRHQIRPYSLDEIDTRPEKDLYVDPLQSFLIMLDFFTRPPSRAASPSATFFKRILPWGMVSSVHAQGPCDAIQGEKEQGYWGKSLSAAQTIAEKGAGLAGEHAATAAGAELAKTIEDVANGVGIGTDIVEGVGGLLILYGITFNIQPTDPVFHRRHDEDLIHGFLARVTFEPDGIPDEVIKCGWLAGKTMPELHRGMKDVELTWNIEPDWPSYLIVPHEVVLHLTGHLGFQTKTDAEGYSDFGISPTDCPEKNGNAIVGRNLRMTVTARVLTKEVPVPGFGGLEGPAAVIGIVAKLGPGAIEFVMHGRKGYCPFRVEWHEKKPKKPQRGGDPNH